jgi:predicted Zn-ribbon and HTH transcriptional regulator
MIESIKTEISNQNVLTDRASIVNTLRSWAKQSEIKNDLIIIPDECEKLGFVEGEYNIGKMLHFLADMLED